MAKERLSRLQKWILEKCLKDLGIRYQDAGEFSRKKYTNRKPEFIGEGHDLKKMYGEDYKKEFDIEKVKREKISGYIWHGLKISRKKELCITNSEKAVISRSLKGLVKKGFLIQPIKYREYRLTKAGLLKANKKDTPDRFVSFKEYQKKIEETEKEQQERAKKRYKKLIEDFKSIKAKR